MMNTELDTMELHSCKYNHDKQKKGETDTGVVWDKDKKQKSSIVLHPDQHNLPGDSARFILSFRATDAGHLSSLVFRSGVIDKNGTMLLDVASPFVETLALQVDPTYDKHTFVLKLQELDVDNPFSRRIFNTLPDYFLMNDLHQAVETLEQDDENGLLLRETLDIINWIAQSNYEVIVRVDTLLSERVIFPIAQDESHSMEDARHVRRLHECGYCECEYPA